MREHWMRQRSLFDASSDLPPLEEDAQQVVTRLLVQWLQELARAIEAGVGDEQDQC